MVRTHKKSLKDNLWFKEPKCKLVSKVVHFLVLFHCFLLLLLFKFYENERHVMD